MDSQLLRPQPIWYDTSYLPALPEPKNTTPIPEEQVQLLKSRGDHVLRTISDHFAISIQPAKHSGLKPKPASFTGLSESDKAFIHRILTSGTSTDKLSALTLLVSSTPLHSRNHLSALLSLAKKKNREEAGRTLRSLVEWLRGPGNPQAGGLPARKLKYFRDQPGLPVIAQAHGLSKSRCKFKPDDESRKEHDEWLATWAFEDWLKNWYLDLLRVIEAFSHDPIVNTRSQSLTHLFYLLKDKPEQEQNLLTLLVNKLGDSSKLICSRSSHYLLQLLQVHPFIKPIVAREISALVLKPIIQPSTKAADKKSNNDKKASDDPSLRHHDHARYYGTITLNQIPLTKGEHDVSNKLIHLYFELFNDLLGKAKVEEEEKAPEDLNEKNEEDLEAEHLEEQQLAQKHAKGRSKKKAGNPRPMSAKSTKAIAEEEALAEKKAKLVAAILTGLNRAFPYGSIESNILKGYMDTLFRITHTGAFSVSIQALILVQHLLKSKPDLTDRFYRVLYGTLIDYRLLTAPSKHGLYLNLLFKSIKADPNHSRVLSFVKRVVQILPYHQPPFICSAIVLLGHLFSTNTKCSQLFSKRPETEELAERDQYDGRKRDPSYANADKSCLWELVPLLSHYHPAVSLNASQLLSGEPISSSVDLTHHTLSTFLDKFVYRQPKKNVTQKGSSIMQPDLHYRLADVVKRRANTQTSSLDQKIPVNSKSFLCRKEEEIPADEVFFHKFFKKKEINEQKHQKQKEQQKSKKSITEDNDFGGKGGSDDGSSEEEEEEGSVLPGYDDDEEDGSGEENNEDEVWAAMKSSMGKELKAAMPDDDGSEDDWSGMDPAEFQDSDGDSEEDGKLKQLLADEEDDEVSSSFENEEISVSGLEDDDDEEDDEEEEDGDEETAKTTSSRKRKPAASTVHPPSKSAKKSDQGPAAKKRKTWKTLPTFASADDYQHLLSENESLH
ncbi:hypothetical protein PTTG_02248 [Puccinia triticina 1-1 BBBD Race 1]|uniref:CBF domain-containing protein n=1 Tax=Puccinia triticina (isolate 1-1 / race 1 (BBBD)) TaxID=630390 RepID=A0A180GK68_PUCT1|nr:hypothetical protein PTTG_02248 [Puccinia triticina 1-1 BBBD Race 1]